ncbi:MAG TPA: DUF1488 family protein [Burkholderiaceae bacterium]|nr:DUF1488 family protein [Burkholderiaceae bacterium]
MPQPRPVPEGSALEFTVRFGGREIAARITREALEDHFGAAADPSTWLRAYLDHRARIDRAVGQMVQGGVKEPVTIRTWHF